jgi:hypothetical protein
MSTYADPISNGSQSTDLPPEEEATLPAISGVQQWLRHLGENEVILDRLDPGELVQRIMSEAFGRYRLPPQVAGMLAAAHLRGDTEEADRQGRRQLATAWFTSQPPNAVDESRWYVRQALRSPQTPHLTLSGHTEDVTGIIRSTGRDGRTLLITKGNDETVRTWDPATGRQIGPSQPMSAWPSNESAHRGTTFTDSEGHTLEAVPYASNIEFMDKDTDQTVGIPLYGHRYWVTGVTTFFGPAGRPLLASASRDYTARIWDLSSRSRPAARSSEQLTDYPPIILWYIAADGSPRVGTIRHPYDDVVQIWDTTTGRPVGRPLRKYAGQLWFQAASARFTTSAGQERLAIACDKDRFRIWDLATGEQVGNPLGGRGGEINRLISWVTPFGQVRLASATDDGSIQVWDAESGQPATPPLSGHEGGVEDLAVFTTRHGDVWLASVGWDKSVCVWDPDSGRQIGWPMMGHANWVASVAAFATAEGEPRLATAGDDLTMRIWDPLSGQQLSVMVDGEDQYADCVLAGTNAAGETRLVTMGLGRNIRVWDPETGEMTFSLEPDFVEKIISFRGGSLAVILRDGWALLQLPAEA